MYVECSLSLISNTPKPHFSTFIPINKLPVLVKPQPIAMADNNKNEGDKKEDGGGGGSKKNSGSITVVLKTNLHCEGCASKFVKCIRSIDGVETVAAVDGQKIKVVGKVDPVKLREKVEQKTHKKVELVSPQPKKDGGEKKESDKGKEKKNEPKDKQDSNDKSDQKKSKEDKQLPVTTAVLKVSLHCDGCIHKIYKTVTKTKGYDDMTIDKQKDLVTVTGAIDAKALAEVLSKQLKRDVEIVPPKKDGGEKKEKDGAGKNNADEKKEGISTMSMQAYPYPVAGDPIHYNPYPVFSNHAPQIFSDENPNACSVM